MDAGIYQETVYQNVLRELRQMDMTLKATQMTLKACPISRDKLVTDDVYVSSLNMKTLKEILKTVSQMTNSMESSKRCIWNYAIFGAIFVASMAIVHKMVKN